MQVYKLEDCLIRIKGTNEYIEIKEGKIFIHCPEWETPLISIDLKQLRPKAGFQYWEREGYQ